jgi:hypothetical protein
LLDCVAGNIIKVDPLFVIGMEQKLEEFGTEAGGPANLARHPINTVRPRKGTVPVWDGKSHEAADARAQCVRLPLTG